MDTHNAALPLRDYTGRVHDVKVVYGSLYEVYDLIKCLVYIGVPHIYR